MLQAAEGCLVVGRQTATQSEIETLQAHVSCVIALVSAMRQCIKQGGLKVCLLIVKTYKSLRQLREAQRGAKKKEKKK